MKILTLNTHSIMEAGYEEKLIKFVEMVKEVSPDLFALQEVNQSLAMPEAVDAPETGYVACKPCAGDSAGGASKQNVPVRTDNHAYRVAKLLQEAGEQYYWTWLPIKIGYGIMDEGVAIFSKTKIENTDQFFISSSRNYCNWKTRKLLGIYTKEMWFYSVHMGWWEDEEEPFSKQWDRVVEQFRNMKQTCFVMGDFNSPADKQQEGYDYVIRSGWLDTWQLAEKKDAGITVGGIIDGWRDKENVTSGPSKPGMRIDYIFCNRKVSVKNSQVVFNGMNYDVVSDHYGVLVEVETL